MIRWKRGAVCASLVFAVAAAPAPPPPAEASADFPARATGNEGTTMAAGIFGDIERTYQAEKERERLKAEQERLAREEAARKAAEQVRLERERIEKEQAAQAEAARATAAAAETDRLKALDTRIEAMTSAGQLFALSDELTAAGDTAGSRAALRALIARFPDHRLAVMAASMLTGQPVAAETAAAASAPQGKTCLAALDDFTRSRPQDSGDATTAERDVFYGKYYEKLLQSVPACQADAAMSARVRDGIKASIAACQKQPGANCTTGVPDTDITKIESAYAQVVAANAPPAAAPPAPAPSPPASVEPKP